MTNSVLDVAEYILKKMGPVTTMKLQKLCFYTQAYSLAWLDRPAFFEKVEAWTNGPVVYALFDKHRRKYTVDTIQGGDATKVDPDIRVIADVICDLFGGMTGGQLSDRTHSEAPWRDAHAGDENGDLQPNGTITHDAMKQYYSQARRDFNPI